MSASALVTGTLLVAALAACGGGAVNLSPATDVRADSVRATADQPIYFEFQVERPAREQRATCAPRYPELLRMAGTTGEVIGQFVVDTAGVPEVATFKAIRSTHASFTTAVQEHLPCVRFSPARIRGRAVRQIVQQPFVFDLER